MSLSTLGYIFVIFCCTTSFTFEVTKWRLFLFIKLGHFTLPLRNSVDILLVSFKDKLLRIQNRQTNLSDNKLMFSTKHTPLPSISNQQEQSKYLSWKRALLFYFNRNAILVYQFRLVFLLVNNCQLHIESWQNWFYKTFTRGMEAKHGDNHLQNANSFPNCLSQQSLI